MQGSIPQIFLSKEIHEQVANKSRKIEPPAKKPKLEETPVFVHEVEENPAKKVVLEGISSLDHLRRSSSESHQQKTGERIKKLEEENRNLRKKYKKLEERVYHLEKVVKSKSESDSQSTCSEPEIFKPIIKTSQVPVVNEVAETSSGSTAESGFDGTGGIFDAEQVAPVPSLSDLVDSIKNMSALVNILVSEFTAVVTAKRGAGGICGAEAATIPGVPIWHHVAGALEVDNMSFRFKSVDFLKSDKHPGACLLKWMRIIGGGRSNIFSSNPNVNAIIENAMVSNDETTAADLLTLLQEGVMMQVHKQIEFVENFDGFRKVQDIAS
ncbi:EIF3A [Mytilus coruscus]|uniref:EIF3A n=1 Tax=Mytilus coruscus TaxID=42192 RepID=A0A6J7ZZA8_MYTCO|nr:EIF3A [Mytilus coruscus]